MSAQRQLGQLRTWGLLLATASLVFLARGGWVVLKARFAQGLLAAAWAESRTQAGELGPPKTPGLVTEIAVRPWPWADTWPVARLRVPAHGIDQIVLAGAEGRSLAFAPGHLAGSASPGGPGNVVLAGHRDTHFRFLRHLVPGDRLSLQAADGRRVVYRVQGSEVRDHRDAEVLRASAEARLTLITCYPFDAVAPGGPLRYVVHAVAEAPNPEPPPTRDAAPRLAEAADHSTW